MNTLLMVLVRALRQHRWLCLFGSAYLFSSISNGLTQTLILGQLLRWHASPATLTLSYMLTTLPGFFGSLLGEYGYRRVSPLRLLLLCELIGLAGLLLPLYGLLAHSIPALLAVQSVEAFAAGLSWPAMSLVFKRGLSANELPAATSMETVIFASQVLLGAGAGVILFDRVSPVTLLSIDAISFVLSTVLLCATARHLPPFSHEERDEKPVVLRWQHLSVIQKRSLLLLPALTVVGAPAMALLPALIQQMRPAEATDLALPLIFARSLGQLCGPLLLNADNLRHYASRNRYLVGCLLAFLAAYCVLPGLSGYPDTALLIIFAVHLASNMVFAVGTFGLLHNFHADAVERVALAILLRRRSDTDCRLTGGRAGVICGFVQYACAGNDGAAALSPLTAKGGNKCLPFTVSVHATLLLSRAVSV